MPDRRPPDRRHGDPRARHQPSGRRPVRPGDDVRGRGRPAGASTTRGRPQQQAKGRQRAEQKAQQKAERRARQQAAREATRTRRPDVVTDRRLTLPNLLTGLRIVCVPVFLVLALVVKDDLLAMAVLVVGGLTDLLDGRLARRLGQRSRLGEVLDPAADRIFVLAVVVALAASGVVPWWFAALLPLRDVLLVALVPWLRSRGLKVLPVHYLGKAATLALLIGFPLLYLAHATAHPVPVGGTRTHAEIVSEIARALGWAFAGWGAGLYWWSGFLYLTQVRRLLATTPPLPKEPKAPKAPKPPRGAGRSGRARSGSSGRPGGQGRQSRTSQDLAKGRPRRA